MKKFDRGEKMLEWFEGIWKKQKVLKRKDMSVYPGTIKLGDDVGFRCCGQGGGAHWWDYDMQSIDLLIDECVMNWYKWFKGYRKIEQNLLPYQVRELSGDCGITNAAKNWITKEETAKLKGEARRIEHSTSYYYESRHKCELE